MQGISIYIIPIVTVTTSAATESHTVELYRVNVDTKAAANTVRVRSVSAVR